MAARDEGEIAHFLTLEALQEYHYRVFAPGAALHLIGRVLLLEHDVLLLLQVVVVLAVAERPLVSYQSGLVTATLRVREEGSPDYAEHLRNAFVTLFDLYGPGLWNVSVTGNAVLQGNTDARYSLWYGQDYGGRSFAVAPPEVVRNVGDSASLRTDYTVDDFSEIFYSTFETTDVSVHSLVNLVWIMTRYLGNYERDQTVGTHLTRLF